MKKTVANELVTTFAVVLSAAVAGCGVLVLSIALLANAPIFAGIGLVAILLGGYAVTALEVK